MRNVTVQFVEARSNRTPVAVPSDLTPLARAIHREALESGSAEAANWLAAPNPAAIASLADEWIFAWQPEIKAVLRRAQSARLSCLSLARLLEHLEWAFGKLDRIAAINAYAQRLAASAQTELIMRAPAAEALLPALLSGWMTGEAAARWALWQLSREALRQPTALEILQRYNAGDAWAVLNMSSEADDFVARVRAWAHAYGRRIGTLDTISAWEEPAQVIADTQALLRTHEFAGYASDDAREASESSLRDDLKEAVHLAQQSCVVARDAEWAWQQFLCEVRLIVREIGRRLARAGVIEKGADAFYLSPEDLRCSIADLHDRGAITRMSLVAQQKRPIPRSQPPDVAA